MNKWAINAIITVLRFALGSGILERIADLMASLMADEALTGADKRHLVIRAAKEEWSTLSEGIIRHVIEIIYLKLKAQ